MSHIWIDTDFLWQILPWPPSGHEIGVCNLERIKQIWGSWGSCQYTFQIFLPRWDHARGFLSLRNNCATFLLELLVCIVLTCAIPSIFHCFGARGGNALNNLKFLPDSCAKQMHSFQLPSWGIKLDFEYRFLVHSRISIPHFLAS